ncbi:glycosyltransferase family 4 protein [Tardiphaga sp.]|jgi:glycosyltransferase involved in cell wall biosynthesis|uniref:glycosyltransferase family 4 protein n=1 Tax=Tardiphaga sp. TaxID=1926292 RepID=UPI0037D9A14C
MTLAPGARILMTTDAVGGVWTFAVALARALAERGMEVLLVSMGPRPSQAQRAMLGGGVALTETDLALEWQDPAGADMKRAEAELRRIVHRFRPDIIHCNGYREAAFGWSVPTIIVAHSCVNGWAEACGDTAAFMSPAWTAYSAHVVDGLESAMAWVAPSASFRTWIARHYGVARSGHVIWNGIAGGSGVSIKQTVILGAGRVWDRAKNLAILAAVASDLDWPIRIAGASALPQGGSGATIDGCGMLGPLSQRDMRYEMQRAAIFVSPALYEPFGLSVLEAAQAGCALVLSDVPAFRELWSGAALFIDPRDVDAWQRALRSLCADMALREAMQQAATERARRYPLQKTTDSYSSLYDQLLTQRDRRTTSPHDAEASA